MHPHHSHVLQLDIQGTPQAWITLEQAALHVATGSVAWVQGNGPLRTLRGGWNRASARQSRIDVYPIVALGGTARINLFDVVPAPAKHKLFRRDRHTCAYCGQRFGQRELQCEHIVPESRGGRWTWTNLVTACGPCNGRKADPHAGGSGHAAGLAILSSRSRPAFRSEIRAWMLARA